MNYKHFTIEEREKIQELLWQKTSIRAIAKVLGRSPASVSRELRKNYGPERNTYAPRTAHKRALENRTHRGRTERLKSDWIRTYVIKHIRRKWSPEQVSNRLKEDYGLLISHETIYQFIYFQVSSGSNNIKPGCEDLRPYLRRRRRIRLPHGARKCQRVLKPKGPSIDDRPKIVDARSRVGDWEGDTVESIDHQSGINTLVERKTGLVFITRLMSKTAAATVGAMAYRFNDVPERFKCTVTLDNGPENRDCELIKDVIGIDPYLAHPYHSWERGTNENTNGLIRDYFPKKTDFSMITDDEIQFVENELNSRPRKRLGWKTPLEAWSVAL